MTTDWRKEARKQPAKANDKEQKINKQINNEIVKSQVWSQAETANRILRSETPLLIHCERVWVCETESMKERTKESKEDTANVEVKPTRLTEIESERLNGHRWDQ